MPWNFVIQLLIVLVSNIVTNALRPKTKPPDPAALGDFSVPTAEEGREVPVIFGTVWMSDPNVTWYGDLRSTPIKSKGGKK
jgi:hypothetical protein